MLIACPELLPQAFAHTELLVRLLSTAAKLIMLATLLEAQKPGRHVVIFLFAVQRTYRDSVLGKMLVGGCGKFHDFLHLLSAQRG